MATPATVIRNKLVVPVHIGEVTEFNVTDGLGVTVKVTSPLIVFGPQAGLPVVDIVTKEIVVFELSVAVVVKLAAVLPVPVIVRELEPSITVADQASP